MNTRTAVATVALACLNLTAIALQAGGEPELFPAGELLVACAATGAVGAYGEDGATLPAPVTGLDEPQDLAFAPDGLLYLSDAGTDLVLVTDAGGALVATLGGGTPLSDPAGIAFGPDGALYVASAGSNSVLVFDRHGELAGEIEAALQQPWGLAFGPDARLYVADTGADRIAVFDPSGTLVEELDGEGLLAGPMGLCFDGQGRLWVASSGSDSVVALDADGAVVQLMESEGELVDPVGLCFGPDGLLYVSSCGTDRVLGFDAAGDVVRVIGLDGSTLAPRGLAFAPSLHKATLKGRLQRPGEPAVKLSAQALVCFTAGRPELGVRLLDPAGTLALETGSDTWVLRGLLARPEPQSKRAVLGAVQVGAAAAQVGFTAAQLRLNGKLHTVPAAPALPARFRLGSASGDFQRSGPQGIVTGTLKIGAPVKP